MYTCSYASPLGEITLASNGHALTGLRFVGQKYYAEIAEGSCTEEARSMIRENGVCTEKACPMIRESGVCTEKACPMIRKNDVCKEKIKSTSQQENDGQIEFSSVFQQAVRWLDIYFSGKEPDFMPEISLSGTPFQMAVWELLKTIPYGQTITYGEIAARIAAQRGIRQMAAQAVGGAVSRNPVSILVPCHRVVGKNGSLTGYAGGINRKTSLLKLEGVDMALLHGSL